MELWTIKGFVYADNGYNTYYVLFSSIVYRIV